MRGRGGVGLVELVGLVGMVRGMGRLWLLWVMRVWSWWGRKRGRRKRNAGVWGSLVGVTFERGPGASPSKAPLVHSTVFQVHLVEWGCGPSPERIRCLPWRRRCVRGLRVGHGAVLRRIDREMRLRGRYGGMCRRGRRLGGL